MQYVTHAIPGQECTVVTVAVDLLALTVILITSLRQALAGTFPDLRHVDQSLVTHSRETLCSDIVLHSHT